MDNRLFNINGQSDEMLLKALELAFLQTSSFSAVSAVSWWESEEDGLVLSWINTDRVSSNKFPSELTAEECFPIVKKWLKSDFAKTVKPSDWCRDLDDFDGSTKLGWQVYVDNWGHVGRDNFSICAIKPAYMWYGK